MERRLQRSGKKQAGPVLGAGNIQYEMADRAKAVACGGLGAIHQMVVRLGLREDLDQSLGLLKRHLPFHESDHILNMAYNVMTGGSRLEDIELRRRDEAYLDAVGAWRIPDPTTAGDFTRRFKESDVLELMECYNRASQQVWAQMEAGFLEEVIIDIDGTIAETGGECKGGIGLSYKGQWGYSALVLSVANTGEVLYVVNRPGNLVSHAGATEWIDRSTRLVSGEGRRVCLRGDTDFSLTANFDRWGEEGVDFVFGMDAQANLVGLAQGLEEKAWRPLQRAPRHRAGTRKRKRPANVKEQIVLEKGYKNIKLQSEEVAEFEYRPTKCRSSYRMVVLRKNLSVERGEQVLFDEVRYYFYITPRRDLTAAEVVWFANGRCNQENVIEQLKNGVHAMRMPVSDLVSNWAYMVIATLAWNLKAWFALLMPDPAASMAASKMEFRRFLLNFILLPCQIIKGGRRIIYRMLSYNRWIKHLFATQHRISVLRL